ncbi:MAG: response regulator transcription factor [Kiritimatiellae bacterium]|nr:response regulator transcription factor [Kiritimatiellia bacterium]
MKDTTVLLVDDHAIFRMGLASLLGTANGIKVVGDAGDGASAVEKALSLRPDVVIMDLIMPGVMDGAEATKTLIEKWPEAKVVILTTYETADGIGHALDAGARGAIVKKAELDDVLNAIRTVAEGEIFVSDEIKQVLKSSATCTPLSPRQTEIIELVSLGLTNEDIAYKLGISATSVRDYLKTTFAKIGAANRAEAVAIAFRKHLLKI